MNIEFRVQTGKEKSNLEKSFLALISAPGFAKFRKVFIHDIKNLARTLEHHSFFDVPNLDWDGRLLYKPDLVPNHQVHPAFRGTQPSHLPGVSIPLDVDHAFELEAAQLLISVQDGFSVKQGFGTTMALRYQVIGVHKWHYIYLTPKDLEVHLEQLTQMSV
ncbi:hypothetical protein D5W64_13065 [Salmonella enterica subsp. enterica serovar Saintpaul]|nr:hypothetical protein [Salmonella enterica subsp. enterica serovar Saintpaul]